MPPSVPATSTAQSGAWQTLPDGWRKPLLALALAWLAVVASFAGDWAKIAQIAWNVSTYNHILLVPVILAWLVMQRAPQLARIEPQAWWPGLLLSAGGCLCWLLGAFSGLDTARQLGAVVILISTVPVLLGVRVSVALAFPLAYALLLVPVGEELVPALQLVTAEITIFLVGLAGIPAYIDGVFIDTPAGLFEVAEACSGVMFLIAMLALGLLVANVCFKSWTRRAIFLAACLIVPIVANGIRAFATVYIAQWVGAEAAVGFDHIVYGWVFFALIIGAVLAGSWRFFDKAPNEPMVDVEWINGSPLLERLARLRLSALAALACLAALVIGAQTWAHAGEQLRARLPEQVALPQVQGWQVVDAPQRLAWEPRAQGADHRLLARYADGKGHAVDVFVALYASQGEGREAGGFGQGALVSDSGWSWSSPGPAIDAASSEWMRGDNGEMRLALTFYRSGELLTGSNARLKLQNMADRITLSARPTTLLIVSAVEQDGQTAPASVRAFLNDAGPVDGWIDHIAGVR